MYVLLYLGSCKISCSVSRHLVLLLNMASVILLWPDSDSNNCKENYLNNWKKNVISPKVIAALKRNEFLRIPEVIRNRTCKFGNFIICAFGATCRTKGVGVVGRHFLRHFKNHISRSNWNFEKNSTRCINLR